MILLLLVLSHAAFSYKEYAGFDPLNPTMADCITQSWTESYLYYGTHDTDIDGNLCSGWTMVKTLLTSPDMFADHNYCRSFGEHKKLGPWCYGNGQVPTRCFPDCSESEAFCLKKKERDNMKNSYKSMSFSGKPCMKWQLAFNSYKIRDDVFSSGRLKYPDVGDRRCKSIYDEVLNAYGFDKLLFAPYCFVMDHSSIYVEPCYASCEIAALETLPNEYLHFVDNYAVGGRQTTWGGIRCKRWVDVNSTFFQLHANTNFCACPSQYKKYCERAGLFCFTVNSKIEWQGCYATEASEDADAKGCIDEKNMENQYLGLRNYTYEGNLCLYWQEGSGIPHGKLRMAMDHGVFGTNYCRNFFLEKEGPWCYVKRSNNVFRQACFRSCEERSKLDLMDMPCFKSSEAGLSGNMPTKRQRSSKDVPCMKWSLVEKSMPDDNFCRVSAELDGLPGCYEITTQELKSCYIPCPGEGGDEFFFAVEEPVCVPEKDRLAWYSGTRSVTVNDSICEFWDIVSRTAPANVKNLLSLYRLGAYRLEDVGAYCRNLDYDSRGPWCMTIHMKKEYCFPRCRDTNVHCLDVRDRQLLDYQGDVHHTISGKNCPVRSGRQTFCRNHDFDPLGPSCEVESGGREPCFPLCSELESASVEYKSFDVALRMAKTIEGKGSKAITHGLAKRMRLTGVRRAQRFAFWVFFFSLMILTLSCVGFPLLRYMPFIKAYLSGQLRTLPKDRGYRRVVKVFHEHGRNPPSFEKFNLRRQQLGPEGDPLLVLK